MATWGELRSVQPELADAGYQLFYEFGLGLGFLGTVRSDGGPRVHPMCPIIRNDRLYALIIPSPKRDDLLRDGRYAMHSYPRPDDEDAFYITGNAILVADRDVRGGVVDQFVEERGGRFSSDDVADQLLFEFDIATALWTKTTGHGDLSPRHTIWKAQ